LKGWWGTGNGGSWLLHANHALHRMATVMISLTALRSIILTKLGNFLHTYWEVWFLLR